MELKPMTWGVLKSQMAAANVTDDTELIMASDPEGNGFSPLFVAQADQHYVPALEEARGRGRGAPPPEDDVARTVVILWPM